MLQYRRLLPIVFGVLSLNAMAADDLMRAYERVVVSNLNATAVQKELDLDHQDVSEFLLKKMNVMPKRGDGPCSEEVMGRLVNSDPSKTIEWFLNRYSQLSSVGRANMVKSLRQSDCKEAYEIVSALLIDKEKVVSQYAAALAPISPTTPYEHLRVCDYAYNSLVWMLHNNEALPSELLRRLSWNTSLEARDTVITRLLDWWSKNSVKVLEQKMSIGTARPSVQEKIRLLLNRQAIGEGSESLEKGKQGE